MRPVIQKEYVDASQTTAGSTPRKGIKRMVGEVVRVKTGNDNGEKEHRHLHGNVLKLA